MVFRLKLSSSIKQGLVSSLIDEPYSIFFHGYWLYMRTNPCKNFRIQLGWVIKLDSNGKVSEDMSPMFELGLMVNKKCFFWNRYFLVLEPVGSLICFFPFCLKTTPGTWSVEEISLFYYQHSHLRSPTQALHNIDCTFMTRDKVN
jgi:hypothetical protein